MGSKVIGYCRVSSREQAENFNALEQQVARVKAAGAEELLIDVESGRGAKTQKRTNYQQLLTMVIDGEVGKIIITRIDRLGRNLPELRKMTDLCEAKGVRIHALDQQLDTSTATGKFQINLLGALAEMYSDELSEKISHGHQHFRNKVRASHPPFGYIVQDFKFYPDRAEWRCTIEDRKVWSKADAAVWHYAEYLRLKSIRPAVQAFTTKFGYQRSWQNGLRNWLKSPVLRGHTVYFPKSEHPEIHYDTHESIITEEQYRESLDLLSINKKQGGFGFSRARHPLSGLLICPVCNGGMIVNSGGKGNRIIYYVCARRQLKNCDNAKSTKAADIEAAVIDALLDRAEEINRGAALVGEGDDPVKRPKELTDLEAQLAGLEKLQYNPAIEAAKKAIRLQVETMAHNFGTEGLHAANSTKVKRQMLGTAGDRGYWESLDESDKREIFHGLISTVLVHPDGLIEVTLIV